MFANFFQRLLSTFRPQSTPLSQQAPLLAHEEAGQYAENEVCKVLHGISERLGNTAVIHNGLFVFDRDSAKEFSVEVDHLLITPKNIYLIETKFKSGVVYAPPNKPFWKVMKKGGYVPFRNGLKQVQNSARVIQGSISLPVKLIPLVVMIGPKLKIHGNNDQVIPLNLLARTIEQIEGQSTNDLEICPKNLRHLLLSKMSTEPADILKHRERVAHVKARKSVELAKHLRQEEPFVIH